MCAPQNSRGSRLKIANIDITVNTTVYLIMVAQCALSFLTLMGYIAFDQTNGYQMWYVCNAVAQENMPNNTVLYSDCTWESSADTYGYFFTFFILYNNFLPISLYITMEMANYAHAHFIDNDLEMYDEEQDVPAMARTSNLGSDLGQIEYIFSDKTGTLTQNVMRFQKCSVSNMSYSVLPDASDPGSPDAPFSTLVPKTKNKSSDAFHFAACLGLCHTIVVEKDEETGTNVYKAESPDEEALVTAAKDLGFEFTGRTSSTMTIKPEKSAAITYKLHALIPFDSARKRMSAVLEVNYIRPPSPPPPRRPLTPRPPDLRPQVHYLHQGRRQHHAGAREQVLRRQDHERAAVHVRADRVAHSRARQEGPLLRVLQDLAHQVEQGMCLPG